MVLKQGHVIPRSLCYKGSVVVITNWLTATKFQFLKLKRIFSISPITDKTFTKPVDMSKTTSVLLETGTTYLREHYCSTQILFC